MPSYPRSHYVKQGEIATYHAWSRCVQRAFLCGIDPVTKKNYDHRRAWIEGLIEYQASIFAVDVGNYNILSNHHHLLVRTRPDISLTWSDEEVAWRWKAAWPKWTGDHWEAQPQDEDIRRLLAEPKRLAAARRNLASLSWFMARVKEPIAKQANAEMERTGHFFEQRFKCRRLEDPPAVLTCSVYMDLNQLAAGQAQSLEESRCSAIRRRLAEWQHEQAVLSLEEFQRQGRPDLQLELEDMLRLLNCNFLAPISEHGPLILIGDRSATPRIVIPPTTENSGLNEQPIASCETDIQQVLAASETESAITPPPADETARQNRTAEEPHPSAKGARLSRTDRSAAPPTYHIHERLKSKIRPRASDNPYLDVPAMKYRELVIWSAARLQGTAEAADEVPVSISETLTAIGIDVSRWVALIGTFETKFHSAVGAAKSLEKFMQRTGRRFIHGIRACRGAFT